MSLPIKAELQRIFTSAMQFYHRGFEQLHIIVEPLPLLRTSERVCQFYPAFSRTDP